MLSMMRRVASWSAEYRENKTHRTDSGCEQSHDKKKKNKFSYL